MSAILGEAEKARIRYHLGYLQIEPAAAIQLGFPAASQAGFLVESAMNRIMDAAVGLVRERVAVLDQTEQRMVGAQKRMAAKRLGEIELRADETDQLRAEYRYWAGSLADILGVPLNVYSIKFRGGGNRLSIPVAH